MALQQPAPLDDDWLARVAAWVQEAPPEPAPVVAFRPAARGTWTIASQAEAIALERSLRAHVFADGRRPDLTTPRLRALEREARTAEWLEDWVACQRAWERWLAAEREGP
jgi:hypothetical protein